MEEIKTEQAASTWALSESFSFGLFQLQFFQRLKDTASALSAVLLFLRKYHFLSSQCTFSSISARLPHSHLHGPWMNQAFFLVQWVVQLMLRNCSWLHAFVRSMLFLLFLFVCPFLVIMAHSYTLCLWLSETLLRYGVGSITSLSTLWCKFEPSAWKKMSHYAVFTSNSITLQHSQWIPCKHEESVEHKLLLEMRCLWCHKGRRYRYAPPVSLP